MDNNEKGSLISLIMKDFDIWPTEASCATQECDGAIIFWSCPQSLIRTAMQLKGCTSVRDYMRFEDVVSVYKTEKISTDQKVAIVRKEEYNFFKR